MNGEALTERIQKAVTERLQAGDHALDLTAGNGHDTLWLAEAVGRKGRVVAFDIQPEAIAATRRRLENAARAEYLVLVEANHANLNQLLAPGETFQAVVANLGYLPGGSHAITTTAKTTTRALDQAWGRLKPGGCLAITAYRGHPGGAEEAEAVRDWADRQAVAGHPVTRLETPPTSEHPPPIAWIIERTPPS